jgi:tRNA pseudouridine13 synthase
MAIRRRPEDFLVVERLGTAATSRLRAEPAPAHAHAVYRLEKTSLTTPEATTQLARALGLGPSAVEHAGLKDKHARTVQHLSAALPTIAQAFRAPALLTAQAWTATRLGFLDRHLRAADIDANAFDLLVTDLSTAAAAEMHRRAALLAATEHPGDLLVLNYFGDQRFGSARHGQGFAARALIAGDFETALRLLIATPARKDSGPRRTLTRACAAHWGDFARALAETPRCPERRALETLAAGGSFQDAFVALPHLLQQLCVEAYQSFLFNRVAAESVAGLASPDTLHADDDFGAMLFPPAAAVPASWHGVSVPLPGPDAAPDPHVAPALQRVLADEGLTLEALRIPGLRRPAFGTALRPLIVRASRFTIAPPEPDPIAGGRRVKLRVGFELPRGAYATVVLRALGQ